LEKILLTLFAIIFLNIGEVPAVDFVYAQEQPAPKVLAYYFHGSSRCPTCHKLEQYSKEAIEINFKDALIAGKLEFKVINVEDSGKQYYVDRYGLYSQALILSLVKDGKETKWENLNKIWEYAGNKEIFLGYVKGKVADFLKETQ